MAQPLVCQRGGPPDPNGASPFAKVIALDFADGPMAGVVQCASCPVAYRFETLAIDIDGAVDRAAWDRGEEIRVFGLATLAAGTFERIVGVLSPLGQPTWPIWAPGMGAPSIPTSIDREVALLLNAAGPPTVVVSAPGLLAPLLAARPAPLGPAFAHRDWMSFLGLVAGRSIERLA